MVSAHGQCPRHILATNQVNVDFKRLYCSFECSSRGLICVNVFFSKRENLSYVFIVLHTGKASQFARKKQERKKITFTARKGSGKENVAVCLLHVTARVL